MTMRAKMRHNPNQKNIKKKLVKTSTESVLYFLKRYWAKAHVMMIVCKWLARTNWMILEEKHGNERKKNVYGETQRKQKKRKKNKKTKLVVNKFEKKANFTFVCNWLLWELRCVDSQWKCGEETVLWEKPT